jgi:hypothetical protein
MFVRLITSLIIDIAGCSLTGLAWHISLTSRILALWDGDIRVISNDRDTDSAFSHLTGTGRGQDYQTQIQRLAHVSLCTFPQQPKVCRPSPWQPPIPQTNRWDVWVPGEWVMWPPNSLSLKPPARDKQLKENDHQVNSNCQRPLAISRVNAALDSAVVRTRGFRRLTLGYLCRAVWLKQNKRQHKHTSVLINVSREPVGYIRPLHEVITPAHRFIVDILLERLNYAKIHTGCSDHNN